MLDARGPSRISSFNRRGFGFQNVRFEMAFARKTVGVRKSSLWIVGFGDPRRFSGNRTCQGDQV